MSVCEQALEGLKTVQYILSGFAQLNTHTGGQDAGGSLIKVERPHTPHAICDERQHVTAHTRHSVQKHMDKTLIQMSSLHQSSLYVT